MKQVFRACFIVYMGRTKGSKNKNHVDKIKLVCPTCKKEFTKYPSFVQQNKKRNNLIYCSRYCADKNRKNVWKFFGKNTSNYKDGNSSYRENAIKIKGCICEKCGYNGEKYPGLIWVHHKDFAKRTKDRNNNIENLEVLCIRCHLEKHYAIQKFKTRKVDVG